MNLFDILASRKIISPEEVPGLTTEVNRTGVSPEEVLRRHGITEEKILQGKSDYLNVPFKSLGGEEVPFSVLEYIPEEAAVHYRFVPLGVKDGVLEVGLVDPDNIEARDALNFISSKINLPFKIYLISENDFKRVVEVYKGVTGEMTQALSDFGVEAAAAAASVGDGGHPDREMEESDISIEAGPSEDGGKVDAKIIEDAPVTKMVATILRYAVEGGASDIHIEPMYDQVRVRFRVDGVLNTSLTLPNKVHSAVVARIKILAASMKLDEKRKPQDGRFSAKIEGRRVDFRVSTFPTYYGEKIVMRILDREKGVKRLTELGLSERNLTLIKNGLKKPYGLILISGPTGSGKTTTLYSMLGEIDKEQRNVLSLEDPIEYNIDGISQSQVRPEIGYTFANGLRTTLRQDPDIIMVGEIRDKETAQLAIQAALTGHLVLSTIHTNNAMGVIPRLIDMGVDQYLIAPTLVLAIAQRLTSTLCPKSGKKVPLDGSIRKIVEKQFEDLPETYRKEIQIPDTVYEINPTPECPTGTRGRTAVYEVIEMDADLDKVVLTNPTEAEITKVVRAKGMLTMKEDAILKAFEGTIPFEEVNKL